MLPTHLELHERGELWRRADEVGAPRYSRAFDDPALEARAVRKRIRQVGIPVLPPKASRKRGDDPSSPLAPRVGRHRSPGGAYGGTPFRRRSARPEDPISAGRPGLKVPELMRRVTRREFGAALGSLECYPLTNRWMQEVEKCR